MCLREDIQDHVLRQFKLQEEKQRFDVDGIFVFNQKRVEDQLEVVKPDLKKQGMQLLQKKTMPQLHSLVQQTYHRMAKELSWLEQKTQIFENPGK